MGTLILLRGLPGAGKSTAAQELFPTAPHFEADMYFMDPETGEYNYDPDLIEHAHTWCQRKTETALAESHPIVVVANTFVNEKDLKVYYSLGEKFDYKVISMIVENRHHSRNRQISRDKMNYLREKFSIKL